jgi:hypothetical protein
MHYSTIAPKQQAVVEKRGELAAWYLNLSQRHLSDLHTDLYCQEK